MIHHTDPFHLVLIASLYRAITKPLSFPNLIPVSRPSAHIRFFSITPHTTPQRISHSPPRRARPLSSLVNAIPSLLLETKRPVTDVNKNIINKALK